MEFLNDTLLKISRASKMTWRGIYRPRLSYYKPSLHECILMKA